MKKFKCLSKVFPKWKIILTHLRSLTTGHTLCLQRECVSSLHELVKMLKSCCYLPCQHTAVALTLFVIKIKSCRDGGITKCCILCIVSPIIFFTVIILLWGIRPSAFLQALTQDFSYDFSLRKIIQKMVFSALAEYNFGIMCKKIFDFCS